MSDLRRTRPWGWAVSLASALTIAVLTLGPGHPGPPPASGSDLLFTDVVLNVLLFAPLGIGLALLGLSRTRALLVGAGLSAAIECAQLWWVPGRFASVHDVVTNGAGCLLGALLVTAWETRASWWRVVGTSAAAAATLVWIVGGQLARPSLPRSEPWYGQWAHDFAGTVRYPGRVLAFTVNGVAVGDNVLADHRQIRARVQATGEVRVEVRVVLAGPFPGRAQLVGLVAANGDELVSLWQEGSAVYARQRLTQSDLSLRTPWLMVGAVPVTSAPGDTMSVVLQAGRREIRLQAKRREFAVGRRLALGPEVFLTGFLPFDFESGPTNPVWLLLPAAAVFLLLGLGTSSHSAGLGIGLAAFALVAGPSIMGHLWPGVEVAAVALAATVAGHSLGRATLRSTSGRKPAPPEPLQP